VATVLEERDLAAEYGDEYRAYRNKVSMMIPTGLFITAEKNK
jgi:protein-S-isoprenylcysteine O-methyltransferase Ste14